MDLLGGHFLELIIVLVVILIIWGPGKLPDIGAAVGRGIREFRKASAETRDAVRTATTMPEEPAAPASDPVQTAPAPEPQPASPPTGSAGSDAG